MMEARRLAAIDIGTVTTRLLVADVGPDGIVREVERSTDITHLGENLSDTGQLSEAAMQRVVEVIISYAETMEMLGVEQFRAYATSASRDASNGQRFRTLLTDRGIEPVIIDGLREAELAFRGATAERTGEKLLVVDCGGGSTELVMGDVTNGHGRQVSITSARSVDVGSRRMTERFLHGDPPTRSELAEARGWAANELRGYFDHLDERPAQMIGLAGTATSLAAIKLGMEVYDSSAVHGFELSGADIADAVEYLASLPLEARQRVVGLHPERAGVIVAGALIFETVLALSGLDRMVVSEHDILYGILLDTYGDLRE